MSLKVPLIGNQLLQTARDLNGSSNDPKVESVCKRLIELHPLLKKLAKDVENLEKKISQGS